MINERDRGTRNPNKKKTRQPMRESTSVLLASITIGTAGLGILYPTDKSISSIERKVDETYRSIASYDELQKARHEILVFDQDVHTSISTRGLPIDSALSDRQKLQRARDAIRLINQEDAISQQRQELHEKLSKEKSNLRIVGELSGVVVGSAFTAIGIVGLFFLYPHAVIQEEKTKSKNYE